MNDGKHPAAKHSDQLAWAVWVDDDCYPVVADSEDKAREKALTEAGEDGGRIHIDGPYQDSEPGTFVFEFVTEHRERIVVDAPNEDYAAESAAAERDYRGEYVQTIRCDSRRLSTKPDSTDVSDGGDR